MSASKDLIVIGITADPAYIGGPHNLCGGTAACQEVLDRAANTDDSLEELLAAENVLSFCVERGTGEKTRSLFAGGSQDSGRRAAPQESAP